MRSIDKIILHCTATPAGREVSVDEIRRWHIERGFSDVGYHYVIHLDGTVSYGRPLPLPGAHCKGHNAHSIGVCYVGGCDKQMRPHDTRTAAQRTAMLQLVRHLKQQHPKATIHGHYEFARKACPSFDVEAWTKEVGL